MTDTKKFLAGAPFPSLTWQTTSGGKLDLANMQGWRMLVVYRGKHCPKCKTYLTKLDGMLDQFKSAGVAVAAVSADPEQKAKASVAESGWHFPVAFGMTVDEMRKLGLYISEPRSAEETDRPFAEPGLYVINAENKAQVVECSNSASTRPDLAMMLDGIKSAIEKKLPVRGTMA
ncbi:MAG: redoxin domain-containing protein [Betaproteobacteria bacterium]